ncbi:cytochrome P450 4c3-like [Diaphorina citri]|uniref:Cytochrome P450 4c3-like n=1 Tax=Diaphorina citri TaxID=121845 RepID=A0A3Q0IV05_DIACI|nr:cytochrome P450 4c3-like [Diaphorina citri]
MGRKINAQDDSNSEYVKAVYEIGSIIQKRQAKIHLQPDFLFRLSSLYKNHQRCLNTLHSFSYKVINERKADLKARRNIEETMEDSAEDVKKRPAFLDLLIEASERHNLSDENIREEVDTFMFEGHDTTSAAICWTLLLLGSNQEIQNKVYEEILVTSFKALHKPFTTRSLNSMKYLEACIKEALRLYPSVPFIARKLSEDVPLPDYVLPRDTEVIIVVYNLHRDPEVFPRPELYDPDRFLSENVAGRNPYAYIPFSAGPRNCIGEEFSVLCEQYK